jgi:uncharacterized protein (TIGR02145 family)
MIMEEPLEIQSSSKPDFSDPMFFQGLFRECLENEVHDHTQWMTIVSLCAQTLYGEIMQQNLKSTKYCNGDPIPMVSIDQQWQELTTGGWSYFDNLSVNESYGRLYNYYAATDDRNPCPCGWHVPTDAEWTQLENYLISTGKNFDNTTQGNKIAKSMASVNMWQASSIFGAVGFNPSSNNTSGFNGIPTGRRFNTGEFANQGSTAAWWTATQQNSTLAWYRWLSKDGLDSKRNSSNKTFGYNIRCIMD